MRHIVITSIHRNKAIEGFAAMTESHVVVAGAKSPSVGNTNCTFLDVEAQKNSHTESWSNCPEPLRAEDARLPPCHRQRRHGNHGHRRRQRPLPGHGFRLWDFCHNPSRSRLRQYIQRLHLPANLATGTTPTRSGRRQLPTT